MNNPVVIGLFSWFLPGAGHIAQGRVARGVVIGAVIWAMFAVALAGGGAYYPGFAFKDGQLLYLLNVFAKLGNGLGSVIAFFVSASPPKDVAAWATFEYAGRFIEVAGLLNFLAVIDALDLHYGRKK